MKKILLYSLAAAVLMAGTAFFILYRNIFGNNILPKDEKAVLLIPSDASYMQAMDSVYSRLTVSRPGLLEWVAEKKQYDSHVKPGRYVISRNISSIALINKLRGGAQDPVRVTFNNVRTLEQLAGKIGKNIEADSSLIITFLNNETNYSADGFNRSTIISVFMPDTYEFFWNTSPGDLYSRMLKEYRKFWNEERSAKAVKLGISPVEVSILASIIDDEVAKKDEKPRIAGVYLNRLRRGMPLQACPTIKFALNDFTITRVLYVHLQTESPYNTYKHKGLPPGPVGCPSKEGIEAVLNAETHDYLYFAAKADFSGYHNFSRTLSEHNRYANQYQRELDRRKIFR